jgi:predicted methyltransferase
MKSLVLSHFQAVVLLQHKGKVGGVVETTPDLGRSSVLLHVLESGLQLPDGPPVTWDVLSKIVRSPNGCFAVDSQGAEQISTFSDATGRLCSLMPTPRAPTLLLSGIPMHRIKGTTPDRDTQEKIRALRPIVGQVLDTSTGLGYTAIEAARYADHVTTIEIDPAVLEIARQNPWSQELFDNPKITQMVGDSCDLVGELEEGSFSRIIHDPPMFNLAGDLYSAAFYTELHRLLRVGGRLFHYVGSPESKSGRSVTAGVVNRLQGVGFSRVKRVPRAFGVVAQR